jgi:hypothetical protein
VSVRRSFDSWIKVYCSPIFPTGEN